MILSQVSLWSRTNSARLWSFSAVVIRFSRNRSSEFYCKDSYQGFGAPDIFFTFTGGQVSFRTCRDLSLGKSDLHYTWQKRERESAWEIPFDRIFFNVLRVEQNSRWETQPQLLLTHLFTHCMMWPCWFRSPQEQAWGMIWMQGVYVQDDPRKHWQGSREVAQRKEGSQWMVC